MSFSSRRPSDTRPIGVSARRPLRWLGGALIASCALLPHAVAHPSRSYLAVTSPLPLRFAPPPPERGSEPTPPVPPSPEQVAEETPPGNEAPTAPGVTSPEQSAFPSSAPADLAPGPVLHETPSALPNSASPLPILPDDLSYRTTADDFLPYFVPPQLSSALPSRATYEQR